MGILAVIGIILDSTPLLRTLWRWLVERQLEVQVSEPVWRDGAKDELKFTVAVEETPEFADFTPSIFTMFTLRLVNHRTDRRERVAGAWLAIKRRRLLFWHRTIAKARVHQRGTDRLLGPPITDIPLEAVSPAIEIQCVVSESLDKNFRQELPRRSEIWLILHMVGPMRKAERKLSDLVRGTRTGRSERTP